MNLNETPMQDGDLKYQLIQELIVKMTDLGNDVSIEHGGPDGLPFSDIAYVCAVATMHALSTFSFTKLSQEGVDNSESILEELISQFRVFAHAAIEDRRAELAGEQVEDTSTERDPWA